MKPGDWAVVLDGSPYAERLGGPGSMYKIMGADFSYYYLDGVPCVPYSESIFREATQKEINDFKKKKI